MSVFNITATELQTVEIEVAAMDWRETLKCRACLGDDAPLMPLFDVYEHSLTLADILQSCTHSEVKDDGLPRYLCENCITILTQFYNFNVIYEQNVAQLKNLLQTDSKDSKQENVVVNNKKNENNEEEKKEEVVEKDDTEEFAIKEEEDWKGSTLEENEDTNSEEAVCEDGENVQNTVVASPKIPRIIEKEDGTLYEERTKYDCKDCGDTFLFTSGIISHMYKKHSIQDINPEEYGEKIHIKISERMRDQFLEQKQSKKTTENVILKCLVCKKIFDTPEKLKEHMAVHKTYVCELCGNSFIKKSYLDDHREAHGTEKNYVCKYCNKSFKRRTVLVKHKKIHTHPRQCVCEICGKRFNDNGTLKTHTLLIHIKERKFKCVICNQSFALKPTLDKHVKRHLKRENGERDFVCDKCGMKYRDKSSLNRHKIAKHSGINFKVQCTDCGKEYTSTTNLLKHRRVHHRSESVGSNNDKTVTVVEIDG